VRALATPKAWAPAVHVSWDVLTICVSEQDDGDLSPEFGNVAWFIVWGFFGFLLFSFCGSGDLG